MTKLAIFADVHANLSAFEAVLSEAAIEGVGSVWIGGDLVGYGNSPAEVTRRAMGLGGGCVMGNHDYMASVIRRQGADAFGRFTEGDRMGDGLLRSARELSEEESEWLETRPFFEKLEGDALLIHASLDEPESWNYIEDEEEALPSIQLMRGKKRQVLFCGHTHLQRVFADPAADSELEWLDDRRFHIPLGVATVVTVGSVGEPREAGGAGRADWVIWQPDVRVVEFRQTWYA